MMRFLRATSVALAITLASPAHAWGDLGHKVTALIAYKHLNPKARQALDELLVADADPLTAPDFASRATWADRYRSSHRETAAWHFVNIEIDHADVSAACFGFVPLPMGSRASAGPAQDCVINKIDQFAGELTDPQVPGAERAMALKFVIHFVGDLHQPLHSSDHHDKGGNCIGLSPTSPDGQETNLHAYWDLGAVNGLGDGAAAIAEKLNSAITPSQIRAWSKGTPRSWSMQAFALAKRDAYHLKSLPSCEAPASIALTVAYEKAAQADAGLQLSRAGIRMAALLNEALGS